jgi:penicillin-binding protein 1C
MRAAAFLLGSAAWILFCWTRALTILAHVPLRCPEPTPIFEDRRGGFLSDGEAVYGALGFWELPDPLPERLVKTAVAIEDKRFALHPGVDPLGLARAILRSLQGDVQGGSTLAMQVVRMGYPRRRTLLAKFDEMVGALIVQTIYGRRGVLRHYLKALPQGGNMYGLGYSARRVFGKPAQDLSWAEAALLMAVPQDPVGRNLFTRKGFIAARARARVILEQLRSQAVIDAETAMAARAELDSLSAPLREHRPDGSHHYVLRLVEEYQGAGKAASGTKPLRTGLDPEIQERALTAARAFAPAFRARGADNLALMVADARSAEVLAYVGSADYFDADNKGAIDYCRTMRSSGSTLKPFIYGLGLESGAFTPNSILADMPVSFKDSRGEYSVSDFDDAYQGPMLYRVALGNSRNVPAIHVLEGVGLEAAYEYLGKFGIHDRKRPASFYGFGLAVGGVYTSLERLVAAYGCLAREGLAFDLRYLPDRQALSDSRLMSEDTARRLSMYLSDPANRLPGFEGTALAAFPFPVAVKTGSSNGYRDAWAIGYSRRYVIGVWAGHSDAKGTNHLTGSGAAAVLLELFTALQEDSARGLNEEPFPPPRGSQGVRICPVSGLLAGDLCPKSVYEYFDPEDVPEAVCDVHTRILVDRRTGRPADPLTPEGERVLAPATILPREYAAFSAARGYARPEEAGESLRYASIRLRSPMDGIRVYIDPDTPARFQSLALRAEVSPAVPEIVWLVDGLEFARAAYPYEARWPLSEGTHVFEARFPNAFVVSPGVSVTVLGL